ncbi:MAG: WD40 repeat domain-containing protein [Planctomycetaceae bacterium]
MLAAAWLSMLGSAAVAVEPPITAMAFAPDGRSVVVGSQAGLSERSWPDLAVVRTIETALVNVHDLEFSPDGRTLAAGGGIPTEEGAVELYDWPAGTLRSTCSGHTDSVLGVAWRNDSQFATASLDYDVVVWNAAAAEPLHRLKGHSRGVAAVCFLPQGDLLVSAGRDQNLRVWKPDSEEMVRTLNNHTNAVHRMALRPVAAGLPMIASVSDDRTVRLWQPTIGRMVRFAQLDATPLAVDWLSDGTRIVVAASDGHVRLIDPDTVGVTQNIPAVDGWAYALDVHPSDGSLLVGGRDGQLQRIIPESTSPSP